MADPQGTEDPGAACEAFVTAKLLVSFRLFRRPFPPILAARNHSNLVLLVSWMDVPKFK